MSHLSAKETVEEAGLHEITDCETLILRMRDLIKTRPTHMREGQWAFSLLFEVDQWLAIKITDTDADPFYRDDNLTAFWEMVRKEHR